MSEQKVGNYPFVAEPFHVDFTGRLTMGVLGNHLLNCAGFHAADRGFGIAELNDNHYTWVLSRLAIELEDMPRQYEDFSIQTWVENVYRLFTDRDFAILDKEGKRGMVVYDVADGRILSERFNTIGEFEIQPNGEFLARANTILYYGGDKGAFYDIVCYVGQDGKIKTDIYNSYDNEIEVLDENTSYREIIKRINDKMENDARIKKQEREKVLELFWKKNK